MRILSIGLLFSISACTWITKDDVDAKTPGLDDDGDGSPKSEDCDDANPNVSPDIEETWYDGVDADCKNDDDYDADVDGFVPTSFAGLPTKNVKGTGILPGGDCNDLDPEINPDLPDTWYDGVDTNCSGNDDYDQDGDEYVPSSDSYGPTQYADGTGFLPQGDCDDAAPGINPGADDVWYDGVDTDCAGNDDYDQDEDLHVPTTYVDLATQYVDGSGSLPGGDCDDLNDFVNPGAVDSWYDGQDTNCGGDDDFDQDTDGYVPDVYVGLSTEYADLLPLLPGGDCNDDPATDGASANPATIEILDDEIDHDCDALSITVGKDTFRLYEAPERTYTGPHDLQWHENSSSIYLAVAARIMLDTTTDATSQSVIQLHEFAPDAATAGPTNVVDLESTSAVVYEFSNGLGLHVTDQEVASGIGMTWASENARLLLISTKNLDTGSVTNAYGGDFGVDTSPWSPHEDSDLAVDGDLYHVIGCDTSDQVLQYGWASRESLGLLDESPAAFEAAIRFDDFSASRCVLQTFGGTPLLISNHDGDLEAQWLLTDPFGETTLVDLNVFVPDVESGILDTGSADTGTSDTAYDPSWGSIEFPPEVLASTPVDLFVPTRGADSWLLIADDTTDSILVIDPEWNLADTIPVGGDPASVHGAFSADGSTLYVTFVDQSGIGKIAYGDPVGGMNDNVRRIGTEDLVETSVWIDAATSNTLMLAAITNSPDPGLSIPIYWGTAYVTAP